MWKYENVKNVEIMATRAVSLHFHISHISHIFKFFL